MIAKRTTPQSEAQRILMEYMIEYHFRGTCIPIENIVKNKFGINISKEDLPDEISAVLSVDTGSNKPLILVNNNHHRCRQRFSIAHELGHYVLHKTKGTHIDNDKKIFFRDSDSGKAVYPIEIEANRFAAELLMPTAFVKKEIAGLGSKLWENEEAISDLAKAFEVSTIAMSLKLQNLGYSF